MDSSFLLQEKKADGVNGKIGKHVGQPGAVDSAQLFVEPIKKQSAYEQASHYQQEKQGREPADHHRHMVKGKNGRTEQMREFASGLIFQIGKHKAPEEELLQKRIDKRDIQTYIQEIILGDTCVCGQGACNFGKIKPGANQKVGTQDQQIKTRAQPQRDQQSFFLRFQKRKIQYVPIDLGGEQRDQQECRNFYGGFYRVVGAQYAVYKRHNSAADHSYRKNEVCRTFFHNGFLFGIM